MASSSGGPDGSGTERRQRGDFLADDRHACSFGLGPASIGQSHPVHLDRQRALTVIYTSLWQLRDLDPEREPLVFRATRERARHELDTIAGDTETSRPPVPLTREAREQTAGHRSGSAPCPPWRRVLARLGPSVAAVSAMVRAGATEGRRSRGRHHRRPVLRDGTARSAALVGQSSGGMRIHAVSNVTPKHGLPSSPPATDGREPVAVAVRRPQRATPLPWLFFKSS